MYLCKRTMQNKTRLELADYEAENLAKLQKLLSKKWEFIYMQAEAQIKVDKKRDKQERKILDSQERAFWDVYRPAPGCLNTTEEDIKKTMRSRRTDFPNIGFFRSRQNIAAGGSGAGAKSDGANATGFAPFTLTPPSPTTGLTGGAGNNAPPRLAENDEVITIENLRKEKDFLRRRLERRYVKTSKVSERYVSEWHFFYLTKCNLLYLFKNFLVFSLLATRIISNSISNSIRSSLRRTLSIRGSPIQLNSGTWRNLCKPSILYFNNSISIHYEFNFFVLFY